MYYVKLLILIVIAVPSIIEGEKLKCYECSDYSARDDSIPPCKGFKPNSTYEIECESDDAYLCLSIVAYHGSNWIIERRSCGVYIKTNDGGLYSVQYGKWDINNPRTNRLAKEEARVYSHIPDCTRNTSLLDPSETTNWCSCISDLCNSVLSIDHHGSEIGNSLAINFKIKPLKCYKCSNKTCLKFNETSTYEIDCENEGSTFCFTEWISNVSSWVVTERGCATLMKKGIEFEVVKQQKSQNPRIKRDYHFSPKDTTEAYPVVKDCHLDTRLLKSKMDGLCGCRSDLCNSRMSIEHRGILIKNSTNPRGKSPKMRCYECSNHTCLGFQANATYEINCHENSQLCFTTLDFDGSNWVVKERGCAGLIWKDGILTLIPHRRGSIVDLGGYQGVSRGTIEDYVRTRECDRDTELLRIGTCSCSFDLCNAGTTTKITSVAVKPKKKLQCYYCPVYECESMLLVSCGDQSSTICFIEWQDDGTNWVVKDRGCGYVIKLSGDYHVVKNKTIERGYDTPSHLLTYAYINSRACHRDISLLTMESGGECYCMSDSCNSKMPTEREGIISKVTQFPIKELKCYQCLNGPKNDRSNSILPCTGFHPNASYVIKCENKESRFCSTSMEFDGFNWTVKERSCAGLMIKNNRYSLIPIRKGEDLSGYKFAPRKVGELYGDVDYCGRMRNPLSEGYHHACGSALCNGEVPIGYHEKIKIFEDPKKTSGRNAGVLIESSLIFQLSVILIILIK